MSKKRRERDMPESERVFDYLKQITRLQSASFFRKPVDIVEFQCQNYYDIIKNPIDLQTITQKLIDGNYKKVQDIIQDMHLIVQNCETYNPNPDSLVRKSCEKFKQCYENRYNNLCKHFQSQDIDIQTYEIEYSNYKYLEEKDQQNLMIKQQKNHVMNGLIDTQIANEDIVVVNNNPVYIYFNLTQDELDKIENHRQKKNKKYQLLIKEKLKKVIEFIQKTNKNHLFTDIQNIITQDPFINEIDQQLEIHNLIRFSQKLILWFRAFHKQDDIFKKSQVKKKFFKHLLNLTKAIVRFVKFSEKINVTEDQIVESENDIQNYYNMIQENQFLSQNLKAHSQNPDKKKSNDRVYHRKHKVKDFDGCDKDKFNKTLKNLLNRKVYKYQQIQQENNQQAEREKTLEDITNINKGIQNSYDEIELFMNEGQLDSEDFNGIDIKKDIIQTQENQFQYHKFNQFKYEDLYKQIQNFDNDINQLQQQYNLKKQNHKFENNCITISESQIIQQLLNKEILDVFCLDFQISSFFSMFSDKEKQNFKKIQKLSVQKANEIEKQLNSLNTDKKEINIHLSPKFFMYENCNKNFNEEKKQKFKSDYKIDKQLKIFLFVLYKNSNDSVENNITLSNQFDISTYEQIQNFDNQVRQDLQNIDELNLKKSTYQKLIEKINCQKQMFQSMIPEKNNQNQKKVIYQKKFNILFGQPQQILGYDRFMQTIKLQIPFENLNNFELLINNEKIV